MASVILKHIQKIYPNATGNRVKGLKTTEKGVVAVDDFNLEIQDKEFIVLVGPSGCGKSTTLRMVAGLEDISGGELYIDGKLCNNIEPKDRDIAMVFQSYALYPHLTVYDNLAFPLRIAKVSKDEIDKKVKEAAEILDITQYLNRKPKALSGGQRQRVAIGRAIVREPKVLLLDEPLSNLDAKLRNQMRAELIKLRQRVNTTFIYVTHDQVEAMTLGDRIVVMKDGLVQQVGQPQDVYDHPRNLFVSSFIGTPTMNYFDAQLIKDGKKYFVETEGYRVELSKDKEENLARNNVTSQNVILGVRPDHIVLDEKEGIEGTVSVSELMGSSKHLHLDVNGKDVIAIVATEGKVYNYNNTNIKFKFNGSICNVFSKENDKNLEF